MAFIPLKITRCYFCGGRNLMLHPCEIHQMLGYRCKDCKEYTPYEVIQRLVRTKIRYCQDLRFRRKDSNAGRNTNM